MELRRNLCGRTMKLPRVGVGVALLAPLLAACEPTPTASDVGYDGPPASLIFFNGIVLTMDDTEGVTQAVALHQDSVMRVGSDEIVLELADPTTPLVDLRGATVLPGIVDAHSHLFNDAWRLDLDLEGAQELALENGITTLANLFSPESFVAEMQDFAASGNLRIRTSLYLIYTDNCGDPQGDWWKAHPPTRRYGERLRIGGIKLFADGGTCAAPAVSVEFSEGSGFGELLVSAAELSAAVAEAQETGHQVVIHAIGDRAVKAAQDGIEAGLAGQPNTLRHRIDHNVVVPADLIPRYAAIGIQPVVFGYLPLGVIQPGPGTCVPADRNSFYQAFEGNTRQLLDELPRAQVAWHGDDPWIGPVSPFKELFNMVTRIRRGRTLVCPPPDWQLKTRITVEDGLTMMTTSSARAIFRENEVGKLRPGKLADLIVVSGNPLTMPREDLWDTEVWMTMIGGEVVFCREGSEVLCPGVDSP